MAQNLQVTDLVKACEWDRSNGFVSCWRAVCKDQFLLSAVSRKYVHTWPLQGDSEGVCCKWPAQVPKGYVSSVRLLSINILKHLVLLYLAAKIILGFGPRPRPWLWVKANLVFTVFPLLALKTNRDVICETCHCAWWVLKHCFYSPLNNLGGWHFLMNHFSDLNFIQSTFSLSLWPGKLDGKKTNWLPHTSSKPPGTSLQQTRLDQMLILGLWGAGTPCAWWAGAFQPLLPRPLLPPLPCESRMKGLFCSLVC